MCFLSVPLSVGLVLALRQGVVHAVLCVCPCMSVGIVPTLCQGRGGGGGSFMCTVCAPVCWTYAFKLTSGGVFNYVHALLLPYSPVIRHLCLYLHRKEMGA